MNDQKRFKGKLLLLIIVIAAILAGVLVLFLQLRKMQETEQARKAQERQEAASTQQTPAAPKLTAAPSVTEKPTVTPTKKPTPTATPTPAPTEAPEVLSDIKNVPAGTILSAENVDFADLGKYFQSYEISDTVFARIYGDDKSFKTYCTVPREDLRYLKLLHRGFDGEIHVGELMVHHLLAEEICEIFRILFENDYQINKMFLVDEYQADDLASIADNNTSAFNFRVVTGGTTLSLHGMGCAIDINPINNPYITYDAYGNPHWEDPDADLYLDRNAPDAYERHMINHQDLCYQLFTERGYTWGGDWANPADYQHFEKAVAYYSF